MMLGVVIICIINSFAHFKLLMTLDENVSGVMFLGYFCGIKLDARADCAIPFWRFNDISCILFGLNPLTAVKDFDSHTNSKW